MNNPIFKIAHLGRKNGREGFFFKVEGEIVKFLFQKYKKGEKEIENKEIGLTFKKEAIFWILQFAINMEQTLNIGSNTF